MLLRERCRGGERVEETRGGWNRPPDVRPKWQRGAKGLPVLKTDQDGEQKHLCPLLHRNPDERRKDPMCGEARLQSMLQPRPGSDFWLKSWAVWAQRETWVLFRKQRTAKRIKR